MNCQSCNQPMRQVYGQSHYHCAACDEYQFSTEIQNDPVVPIAPSGKITDFQCPKCELPLEVGAIHGKIQACFCSNCRGFVIDSQSLGEVASDLRMSYTGPDDRPQPIDPSELDTPLRCPACWENMESHPYYGPGNIVLNTCGHCQLAWLDHGELAKIVRAPGPRPNQPSAGNYEIAKFRSDLQEPSEPRQGESLAKLLGF